MNSLNCNSSIAEIETQRLVARRMREDDLDGLCRMHRDARVMATLGGVRSDEESNQMLEGYLDNWNRFGFGLWMWFSKADGRFVGRGGVKRDVVEGSQQIVLGYALMPDFWRRGLATEIAKTSVEVAFNQRDMPDLVSFTRPTNVASRRVMEKCGFTFERDIIWKDLPHVLYRLTRENYGHHVRQQ